MKSADIFKEIEFESKLIVAHLMYIFTIGTFEKKTASFEQKIHVLWKKIEMFLSMVVLLQNTFIPSLKLMNNHLLPIYFF